MTEAKPACPLTDGCMVPPTTRTLHEVLGPTLLAGLAGISVSDVRRHMAGESSTSDMVAARFRFLGLIVGDLAGAYNDVGIRRWFERPRSQLGGSMPASLLVGNWRPNDTGPRQVRELAGSLTFQLAT